MLRLRQWDDHTDFSIIQIYMCVKWIFAFFFIEKWSGEIINMSAKAIREATGKELINKYLEDGKEIGVAKSRFASVNETTDWNQLVVEHPWLETTVSGNFIEYIAKDEMAKIDKWLY